MNLRAAVISVVTVGAMTFGIFAQGGRAVSPRQQTQDERPDTALIFMKADAAYTLKLDTSTVMCFVGNFAAHHNGAIITADSAVRYSDTYVECFGDVLINKNTTYVYGDRADYDSESGEARVYSHLVKMVDGDAVLYTYNFAFDTDNSVGRFYGGGMVINRENRLESERGYYYSDFHEVICVDSVQVHTESYDMKGDSVVYNIDNDHAWFFRNSNIWNGDGDYLYADRGEYDKQRDLYSVTSNGYVLTEKQEVWSDSIDYFRTEGRAVLRRDIQLDDAEYKTLAFGDYGEYWADPGNVFLTRQPAVVSYDTSQGDSVFMRSDSIYLYTVIFNPAAERRAAEEAKAAEESKAAGEAAAHTASELNVQAGNTSDGSAEDDGDAAGRSLPGADILDKVKQRGQAGMERDSLPSFAPDSLAVDSLVVDSLAADSLSADSVRVLTPEELKAKQREEKERLKAEKRAAAAKARKERLDRIADERLAKLRQQKERDEAAAAARKAKAAEKMRKRAERENERRARKGLPPVGLPADSVSAVVPTDSMAIAPDSVFAADSLAAADSMFLQTDSLTADTIGRDSMYRLLKGFRNVRIYRSDFQALCDSIVALSNDSTVHMYLSPVLWNGANQVTSDVMDIFTANGTVSKADFVGKPIMASQIDTLYYNQVAGKNMTALFREGTIYRNDVNGNAQTIYYVQDGEGGEVTDMMYLESAGVTFYIADQTVDVITYRGSPVGIMYPLTPQNMVPETQIQRLPDFVWRGSERPVRKSVMERTVRPSRREEVEAMPRPEFPISRKIEKYKARLIERRRWLDRVDVLSPEDEEFMKETLAAPYR